MNKKLISKCCHKYVIEQWFCGKRNYVCSGCNNQDCEVIEDPIPQPIQKEEEVEEKLYHEPTCRMRGLYLKGDALTGECTCIPKPNKHDWIKDPTPSDTFIEMKIEEFHRKYDFSENETLEYDNLIGIADFLKSSLQEARQSILEEIEKKTKIKNKLCTHEQTWYFVDGYNQALEDIKQLLKDNKE